MAAGCLLFNHPANNKISFKEIFIKQLPCLQDDYLSCTPGINIVKNNAVRHPSPPKVERGRG
jgi:hypothetical protein